MKNRSVTYRKTMKTLPLVEDPAELWRGRGREQGGGEKDLTGIARRLREHSTDTERHLWRHLRDRQIDGFKFRRQQRVGSYVVDFVNLEKKVVIELDGGQHALDPGDKIRDEWLKAEGYKVLRFWDNQVFSNLEGVLETIREVLLTPHPVPLPCLRRSGFAQAGPRGEGR
jgi:very-short-patch-repair endonuclease